MAIAAPIYSASPAACRHELRMRQSVKGFGGDVVKQFRRHRAALFMTKIGTVGTL